MATAKAKHRGGLREYFWLSQTRALTEQITENARLALHADLNLARQRAEAAEALWSNGHSAEGLRLAADALGITIDSILPFGHALGIRPQDAAPSTTEADDTHIDVELETAISEDVEGAEPVSVDRPADDHSAAADDHSAAADDHSAAADDQQRASTPPAWAQVLAERGLSASSLRNATRVVRTLETAPPKLDDDVSPSDAELYQQYCSVRRQLELVLMPATMTPRDVSLTRMTRVGLASLLSLGLLVGLIWLLQPGDGISTIASATFGNAPDYGPHLAIDGDLNTEWLLPDRTAGWMEVRFEQPRRIANIRLRNGHNRNYNDRATHDYTIEVFVDGEAVREIEASFSPMSANPEWVAHEIGIDRVHRIRFTTRTWYRTGGSLAEIAWD